MNVIFDEYMGFDPECMDGKRRDKRRAQRVAKRKARREARQKRRTDRRSYRAEKRTKREERRTKRRDYRKEKRIMREQKRRSKALLDAGMLPETMPGLPGQAENLPLMDQFVQPVNIEPMTIGPSVPTGGGGMYIPDPIVAPLESGLPVAQGMIKQKGGIKDLLIPGIAVGVLIYLNTRKKKKGKKK